MKRLAKNIILLLLPIFAYYALFLAFEPNNYFGLRRRTPPGTEFGALREYRLAPTRGVVLGDSRMAYFDMDRAGADAGHDMTNLAFGGASLKEQLDELDWLLAHYPQIDEVVFGLSFYTLNESHGLDRWETIEKGMQNPFVYLTSLSYNLQALENAAITLQGGVTGGGESETKDPAGYVYAPYRPPHGGAVTLRADIAAYLDTIEPYLRDWRPNTAQFDRLLERIEQNPEVRFAVVLPPMHGAVMEYLVKPRGIDTQMRPFLDKLSESRAVLLDYEFGARAAYPDEMFFDGLHLDYERGLPVWAGELFTAIRLER